MGDLNINKCNPVGEAEDNKDIKIVLPVPLDASNASSIQSSRETNSLSRIDSIDYLEKTHTGGSMLGTVKPLWIKVTESEQRISWLKSMIDRELVVRDLEAYAKKISAKLRSDEYHVKEEERVILMNIMKLKLKDEKRNLIALNRKKDEVRRRLLLLLGKGRKLDSLLSKLRKDMIRHKNKLKKKYKEKLEHLDTERQKDIEKKKRRIVVPDELDEFRDISIYDDNKRQSICKQIVGGLR